MASVSHRIACLSGLSDRGFPDREAPDRFGAESSYVSSLIPSC